MEEMTTVQVKLPGSEGYWSAYEHGGKLEEAFPGQDAYDFMYAIQYNGAPFELEVGFRSLVMLEQGYRDGVAWRWYVVTGDLRKWIVDGWCDYTGWDCQSGLTWVELAP